MKSEWDEAADKFVDELALDLEARGIPFKLVVKPCNSAGTDGVTFVDSVESTRQVCMHANHVYENCCSLRFTPATDVVDLWHTLKKMRAELALLSQPNLYTSLRTHNQQLSKQVAEELLTATNMFGKCNESVLIQEYLAGEEFVVDTVSVDGEHKVCCFFRYDKRDSKSFVRLNLHRTRIMPFATLLFFNRRLFEYSEQ